MKRKVKVLIGDGSPFLARKQGRNDLCSCGSKKKAKNCCGTETRYFSTKKKTEKQTKL